MCICMCVYMCLLFSQNGMQLPGKVIIIIVPADFFARLLKGFSLTFFLGLRDSDWHRVIQLALLYM